MNFQDVSTMDRQQSFQIWRTRETWSARNNFPILDYHGSSPNILRIRAELGEKGLLCALQGLSRPISPNTLSVRQLISDWERWSDECCFQGTVDDLLNMKQVHVIAISYRHEPDTRWKRHGQDKVSKMSDRDQKALEEAIERLQHYQPKILLWCDQILSARLQGEENSLGWYNAGLIPYAHFPVLALSIHPNQSANELEKRVWIKAERSLGRMGSGLLLPDQLFEHFYSYSSLIFRLPGYPFHPPEDFEIQQSRFGEDIQPRKLLRNVSFMILSGYWPEPPKGDHWYNDYHKMKEWAIYVSCRSYRFGDSAIFDKVAPVDFTEVLGSMHNFSTVPQGSELPEREYFTRDKHFYLKVTAWNPWISNLWPSSNTIISHYMGSLGFCKFTWWISNSSRVIFGCMVTLSNLDEVACRELSTPADDRRIVRRLFEKGAPPTIMIAVRKESGYTLFRSRANPDVCELYVGVHSEVDPSREMKKVFQSAAKDRGMDINLDEEWSLLFSWDSLSEVSFPPDIMKTSAEESTEIAARVPYVLMGTTARLFQAAAARDSESSVLGTFVAAIHSWNEHIKASFETYVHVTDSENGPVWLEGYTENYVTFGFLDFLTRTLFVHDAANDGAPPLHHEVVMPSETEMKEEILRASRDGPEDIQLIAEELFGVGTTQNDMSAPDNHEKASFVISGGFTNTFHGFAVAPFVRKIAKRRGYWWTAVGCRNKKMHIVFRNQENVLRIAQRSTSLKEYAGFGLVRPGKNNSQFVLNISENLSEKEAAKIPSIWKDMQDTFSRAETSSRLSDAKLPWGGAEAWLIDTTLCNDSDQGINSYYNGAED